MRTIRIVILLTICVLCVPITQGQTVYDEFNQFCRDNFGAEQEPLVYERFGSDLQFVESGFWAHESRNSAAIAFETNLPAITYVEFGPTGAYGHTTPQSDREYYLHLHHVTGLQPEQTYHYRLVAIDERGNTLYSSDRILETHALASHIDVPGTLQGPPYVLDQADASYVLMEDIVSDTRGITIAAHRISLDLNGFTITYDEGEPLEFEGSIAYNDSASVGVGLSYANAVGPLVIRNGTIRQGANNGQGTIGIGFNPILIRGGSADIAGIIAEYSGHSVSGIVNVWGETTAHHNVIMDRGTGIDNRHQGIKSIYSARIGDAGIYYNLVKRARQQAFMHGDYAGGGPFYANEIYLDSYDTNSFGIKPTSLVYGNRIFGTGYHAVGIGFSRLDHQVDYVIRDNFVHMQGVAPTNRSTESGTHSSVIGVRITQYSGGTRVFDNFLYEGNTIIVKAREGCSIGRGVQFSSSQYITNLRFRNNIVKTEIQDDVLTNSSGYYGVACVVGQGDGETSEPIYYEDNLFLTNHVFVKFGDPYSTGSSHHFRGNEFIKFDPTPQQYNALRVGYGTSNSYNNRLVDTACGDGVSLEDNVFVGSASARLEYSVGHSLHLIAQSTAGGAIALDSLRVLDNTGTNYRVRTDEAGNARLELLEYTYEAPEGVSEPTRVSHEDHELRIDGYEPVVVTPELFAIANNGDDPVVVLFAPLVDETPPAEVADLAVNITTQTSVSLTWTAVGNDGVSGTASQYDLRYSTATITEQNWATAVQVEGEPVPGPSGTAESMTVEGLEGETTYYFALKVADGVPNWSGLSNVASGTTQAEEPPPDETPPAAVADLSVAGTTQTTANLTWATVGDDGMSGTASQYDLRYSTASITEQNWAAAVQVEGEPAPGPSGTGELMTVEGLQAGTTYYFALKVADEVPNWSELSNVPSAATTMAAPVAQFSASPRSGTAPLQVSFTDASTGDPDSWSWSFGDGDTSNAQNPVHTYAAAGSYTVSLTVTNAGGSDGETKTGYVTVSEPVLAPVAQFSGTPTNGTAPLAVSFTDASSNDPTSWSWSFGDGGTSSSQNPNHAYEEPGTYTVTLTVTNDGGSDSESKTDYITVSESVSPPEADFEGTPTSGMVPLAVTFTDASSNDPTSWSWSFGDGETSSSQNPSHTYEEPGTYTVSLTVTNASGSDSESKTDYITVSESVTPPEAEFEGTPTSGTAPLAVSFTDASSNDPTSWSWSFGDGGTSTSQHPTHTYQHPGTYSVTLTVTNPDGSDSVTKTDYIEVSAAVLPPDAGFEATPRTGNAPLTVTFSDSSTNAPASWEWAFGDGGVSTEANPQYTYEQPGTYTVSLTVANAGGEDAVTKTDYIFVSGSATPPQAGFVGAPTAGQAPLLVSFTDNSTGLPTSWDWDFGEGTGSTDQHPQHEYADAGTYTVTLIATNDLGSSTKIRKQYITVEPETPLPTARLGAAPRSGQAPLTVAFTDSSTGTPDSWIWSFGDGHSSDERHPSHTYETPGIYDVSLSVSNSKGTDTAELTSYIEVLRVPTPPVAQFEGTPTEGIAPLEVVFTDLSSQSPTSWSWDFGDDATSTEQHPAHTYDEPGIYTVRLTARNADGENALDRSEYIRVLEAPEPPIAAFEASPTSGIAPLNVQFQDQSLNAPATWSWDFGDGSGSQERNPTHAYSEVGTFSVTLIAANADGSDTLTVADVISVSPAPRPPVADFAASDSSGVAPLAVTFQDLSSNAPSSWLWNFGDGQESVEQHPTHTYVSPDSYTVSLTVENADGSDTAMKLAFVVVLPPPTPPMAQFESDRSSGTAPLTVNFTDLSSNAPMTWLWEFGDGSTADSQHPAHIYTSPGDYTVILTVSNEDGADSETKESYILVTEESPPEEPQAPTVFSMAAPNPYRTDRGIAYSLARANHVRLEVFRADGTRVATLVDAFQDAGIQTAQWNAGLQPGGVYFLRLRSGKDIQTSRLILVK